MDYIVDRRAQSWIAGNSIQRRSDDALARHIRDGGHLDLWGRIGVSDTGSTQLPLPFPSGAWSESVTVAPPPPDAPIPQWMPAIRADIKTISGLSVDSAKRAASGRHRVAAFLASQGITTWDQVRLDQILEFANAPRRDIYDNAVRDRDPDEIRTEMWRARHIVAAAVRLGAPVPSLDSDSELHDFLYPPQKPDRKPDDPEEIDDTVSAWRPQRWRHGSLRGLDEVLPGVRERVLAAEPADTHEARKWLQILSGFTMWARFDRHSDPVGMHTPNNVETWVTHVNADQEDEWRNRARGVLRRLGPIINPPAWSRPPRPIPRRGVVAPYDSKSEQQFRRAAMLPRRDRRTRLWIVIAAPGAGLDGPAISASHYDDLVERPDGRWEIHVRGEKPRRVPIRRDYIPLVEELVAMDDESQFIASDRSGAVNQIVQRIRVSDESLSLTKARTTFLAAHLEAGTPPACLSVIAGGVSYGTLDRLLPYVADRVDPDEAVERALGA